MVVKGEQFTLVGDAGALLRFQMTSGGPGPALLSELPSNCGFHWNKPAQDSELIARDPTTDQLWIGLENQNALCRIGPTLQTEKVVRRPEMKRWSKASGAETLARLNDGRFLVIAEGDPRRGVSTMPVLLFDRDPIDPEAKAQSLVLRTPPGFRPVDAAQLPDGRILMLIRNYRIIGGFTGRLVVLKVDDLQPGATISGAELARFEAPVVADNFEAIAISRNSGGIAVWIASDDNFFFLQRNLLLKFRLAG